MHLAEHNETTFEKTTRWLSLFLLAPLLLTLTLPTAVNISRRADYGLSVHRLEVVGIVPGGPAQRAGVSLGDQVVAVNGRPTQRAHEYYAAKAGNPERQAVVFRLRDAQGKLREVSITPGAPSQSDTIHSYSQWIVGISFLIIGWWVLKGRRDPVARNFFWLCLIFAFFLADIPDQGNLSYMLTKELLRTLLQLLLPAFFVRFFLLFPASGSGFGRRKLNHRLLLVPGWLLFILSAGLDYAHLAPAGGPVDAVLSGAGMVYALGSFITGLAIFARRILRRDRPIQQSKLRVVFWGLVGGLAPFWAATAVGNFAPGNALPHWQFLSLSLLLVPISFGLAIMRFGALDAGFIVRLSLVYGVVTLLVLLGYFLIVGLVATTMAHFFAAGKWPVLVMVAALSGLAILPLRNAVQAWVDNTFYPARRADRRAVGMLAEELTVLIKPEAVVAAIQSRLLDLYRPHSLAIFLPATPSGTGFLAAGMRQGDSQPTSDTQELPGTQAALPQESALAHLLNRLRRPTYREEIEDYLFAGDSDAESLQLLTRLDLALVVPMITGDRLIGFIAFGPKRSGDLYSQDDLSNLRAIAMQAASLVESRQLYQASLQRERLEAELEVARDIQANLLPDAALEIGDSTILGRNEPCRMVGGDYFDYFKRDGEHLCFAIADVSGKGVPAALMMTSVRVAFHQEAQSGLGPAAIIGHLNAVVNGLRSQGHFICFFCGLWSAASGVLHYCNAGMEPPVLYQPRRRYRSYLKRGGPVLGVDPQAIYREGALSLLPGDRLFLYSDGLTEERNDQDEFFEAERLHALVAENLTATPDTLLGQIFAQVDTFGGAERSDDRTAMILSINTLNT